MKPLYMAFKPCPLLGHLSNVSRNTKWIWFAVHFYFSSLVTSKYLKDVYQRQRDITQ